MSLSGAITALQAHALSLSAVDIAPTWPPESVSMMPASICYPYAGRWHGESAGWKKGVHTLLVEFLISPVMSPQAVQTMVGLIEDYPNKILADPTLGGAVDTILSDQENPIRYEIVIGMKGELVLKFFIQVKIQSALT